MAVDTHEQWVSNINPQQTKNKTDCKSANDDNNNKRTRRTP